MERHTEDLHTVSKGDRVTIETSSGRTFDRVECATRNSWESILSWEFSVGPGERLRVSIVRSDSGGHPYGFHRPATFGTSASSDEMEQVGYFESVQIHGKPVGA